MLRMYSSVLILALLLPTVAVCCPLMSMAGIQTCESSQAAIAETKTRFTDKTTIEYGLGLFKTHQFKTHQEEILFAGDQVERIHCSDNHGIDICLRTGALLI